jgi:TonB-dependent SusC/RagA subfamily outer membrane receptor
MVNSPLYIVDGIQASYSQINPSDIATIDVLKDASSTAIYGSAGANGLLLLLLKKEKKAKQRLTLTFYGISGQPHFTKSMIGEEYMTYRRELYRTTNGCIPMMFLRFLPMSIFSMRITKVNGLTGQTS